MLGNSKYNQSGFTVVELMTSMTVSAILLVSVMAVSVSYFALLTRTNIRIDIVNENQNYFRSTSENIRTATALRPINLLLDTNAPVGGWNTNGANFTLVIAVPAKDSTGAFITDPLTKKPLNNEIVYYKSGLQLYKRSITNPAAIGTTLKTSCPPPGSPGCPADAKLLNFVSNISYTLYDQNDSVTAIVSNTRSIKINLTQTKDTFGNPIVVNDILRVSFRNSL